MMERALETTPEYQALLADIERVRQSAEFNDVIGTLATSNVDWLSYANQKAATEEFMLSNKWVQQMIYDSVFLRQNKDVQQLALMWYQSWAAGLQEQL